MQLNFLMMLNRMLDDIIKGKKLTAKAVFGLFPAYSFGEDVSIFKDESKNKHITTLHFLRQQVQNAQINPMYVYPIS